MSNPHRCAPCFEWSPNLVKPPLEPLSAGFETDSKFSPLGAQITLTTRMLITHTIAVKTDTGGAGSERNTLTPLIKKGALIPASGVEKFRASRDLRAEKGDFLGFELFEQAENVDGPDLNLAIGAFRIDLVDLERGDVIRKGDDVFVHWSIDANALLNCTIEIPSIARSFNTGPFVVPQTYSRSSVRARYNARPEVWPLTDAWHRHNYEQIADAVRRLLPSNKLDDEVILNVGSGGNAYGISAKCHFHLDLAERRLPIDGKSIVGTAETLPFKSNSFSFVLCVGDVINYCDPVSALSEIARVLAPGGRVLLEFESSTGAEYLFKSSYGLPSICIQGYYQNQQETIWIYNPRYIKRLLSMIGLEPLHDEGFHSLTALSFRSFGSWRGFRKLCAIERLSPARRWFRHFACNRIFVAQKSLEIDGEPL